MITGAEPGVIHEHHFHREDAKNEKKFYNENNLNLSQEQMV